jgi:hypothetical protein
MFVLDNKIIFEKILVIDKRQTTHEFKDMAKFHGEVKFQFEFYSLNYKGLDYKQEILFKVLESSEKRNVIYYLLRTLSKK